MPPCPATAGALNPGSSASGISCSAVAQCVGGREPARAHHQGDVVVGSAGALTQGVGGLLGQFLSSHLPYITTVVGAPTGGDSLGGNGRLIR